MAFSKGRDKSPDSAEDLGSIFCSVTARDLLLKFEHSVGLALPDYL